MYISPKTGSNSSYQRGRKKERQVHKEIEKQGRGVFGGGGERVRENRRAEAVTQ